MADVETPDGDEAATAGATPAGAPWSDAAVGDDGDLAASLSSLARLSASQLSLEQLLERVASYAVHAIPGADGAGVTLNESSRADTIVMSADFVKEVDDIQYGLGEGPCITAFQTGTTMRSGSLGGDRRWPRFGPRAGRLGVHSVLSLPLITPDGVIGAMNVYAHAKNAFDERSEEIGEIYAAPAAFTAHNAQLLAQTNRLAIHLQQALSSRTIIDQAIGVLRSRSGISPDEAFSRLRQMSQQEHIKLATVAESIVEEAVRRARARRDEHGPSATNLFRDPRRCRCSG